ncbi:MAG: hypothetical protein LUI87_11180 [Lachnospiraceae bacterium]|nr:hypothetical protein [Lachnospiraceae bacterium]
MALVLCPDFRSKSRTQVRRANRLAAKIPYAPLRIKKKKSTAAAGSSFSLFSYFLSASPALSLITPQAAMQNMSFVINDSHILSELNISELNISGLNIPELNIHNSLSHNSSAEAMTASMS